MIDEETLARIKRDTELKAVIESRGVKLTKNGKGYVGLCPFHEDQDPSLTVNLTKNLWQCFGCGTGGDAIRFVELADKVSFKEAVKRLQNGSNGKKGKAVRKAAKADTGNSTAIPESKAQKLLERVVTLYEKNFAESAEGRAYLAGRGITDMGLTDRHRVGYASGTLKDLLPKSGAVIEELRELGVLTAGGRERYQGSIVVPVFDMEGRIVTLYGRSIEQGKKRHLFLPNRSTGLWNVRAARQATELIVTESVLDAMSVETAGYGNVVAVQGTSGLKATDIALLKQCGVQKLVLLMDGDGAGRRAGARLKERISGMAVNVRDLPEGEDPNSYLVAHGAQGLARFLAAADAAEEAPCTVETGNDTPDGFQVRYGLRRYHVLGLDKGARRLKATVRVEHKGKLHVDTVDFYSARAGRTLAQDLCRLFEEVPETIDADVTRLMLACEKPPRKASGPKGRTEAVRPRR